MTSLGGRLLDGLTDEAAFEVDRLCDEVDAWSSEPQPPSFAEFRSRLSQSLGKLAEQFPSQPGARQAALFFIVSTIARTYLANGAWSVATASDLETVCGDETERSLFRQAVDEAVADAAASRSSSSSASATSQTLKRIGQYELIETLGAGGMGVVFKGRDPHSHRVVAIKVMRSDLAGDEESRERFRREARALQRLDHPGIVRQFREGVDDGRPYLVMEYVDGGSLQERAADAPLEPIVAAELLADVCDAAEYLHREGLIHRDVKPQNILLTSSGQAKLADFGLAKHLHATSMLTNTGQAIGTPSYMPPEQVRGDGDAIIAASDIYAIGATLYRLVCGRPPFQAASPLITIAQILNDDPPAPRQLNPAVPEDLELICLKCLEKEPARRFQTAAELGAELRRFVARQPLLTRRPNWLRLAATWYRKNQIVTVAATLIGLILLFATALSLKYSRDSDQAARMLRRQLVANHVAAGWQHMQSGDPAAAAVLFTSALRTDSQSPLTHEIHRQRAAHAQNSTPQPLHAWMHESPIISARFSPDGAKVLTAGTDGAVKIWDARSGRNLGGVQIRSTPVTFANFSPDSRLFAVAAGNTVSIWDGETERLACPPLPHDMVVNHFAFHPDGRWLVTGAGDSSSASKTVFRELPRVAPGVDRQRIPEFVAPTGYSQQWDISTGQPLGPRMTQTGGATWVEYSRDGLLIVSASPTASILASANGRDHVRIWDARTSLARNPPLRHRHEIGFASLNPLDSRILTASNAFPYNPNPTSAWLWKTHSDIPEAIELSHRGSVTLARFTPDGARIVTATRDGGVRVWDGRDGTPLSNTAEHGDAINDVSVSSSGRRFATAARDGTAAVWDTASCERVSPLLRLAAAVVAVSFSPDERHLLTTTLSGEACLWDLQIPSAEHARLVHSSPVGRLQFTADNRLQSWTLTQGNLVTISNTLHDVRPRRTLTGTSHWNLDDNSLVSLPLNNDSLPRAVAWSACGRREIRSDGYRGGGSKPVAVELVERDEQGLTATRHVLPSEIAVGAIASSKPLAILGLNNGQFWRFRAADAAPELILETDRDILHAAVSRDGRFAVAVSRARNRTGSWTLHFFGPDREVRNIDHEAPVRSLQFSPDDRWLVVDAGAGGLETGGAIRLWNPATAKAVGKSLQHPRLVHAIAFSPDLGHVATACDDGLVRLWRLADSQPGDVIIRLPRAVNSVAFAPDGRRLATACEDGGVRIWDTLTGEAISPPWRHELAALHVAFDNSGHRLASASLDETVRIWNAVPSSSSPTELLLRAEIASARRLSSAGTLRPLTQAEYRGVWRRKAGAQ